MYFAAMLRRLIVTGALLYAAAPAAGQSMDAIPVDLFFGVSPNALAPDAESWMRDSGFDDDGEIDAQEHPWSTDRGEGMWLLRAAYQVRPRWRVALAIGDGPLGKTTGFRDWAGLNGDHLLVAYAASSLAPEIRYQVIGPLELGVGPAVYRLRASCGGDCTDEPQSETSLGATADATLTFRVFERLRLSAMAQYRLAGVAALDSWRAGFSTVPPRRVDYSHTFFAVGVGLDF